MWYSNFYNNYLLWIIFLISVLIILNKIQNNREKKIELLDEIVKDLKNYELEFRIEELESKFSRDLSESTFDEIRELKKDLVKKISKL